ncbi:hypothetical protein HN51_053259 [Arachis hypogaea]
MKLCNPATKPCPTMTSARFFHSSHLHIHGGFTSVLLAIPPFSRNSLTSLDRVYFCTNWSLPPLCVVSKIGFSAVKDEVASRKFLYSPPPNLISMPPFFLILPL